MTKNAKNSTVYTLWHCAVLHCTALYRTATYAINRHLFRLLTSLAILLCDLFYSVMLCYVVQRDIEHTLVTVPPVHSAWYGTVLQCNTTQYSTIHAIK